MDLQNSSSEKVVKKMYPFTEPQRLRVYAFLSMGNEYINQITPLMASKMHLTIVSGYNFEDAIIANGNVLKRMGLMMDVFPAFQTCWEYYDSIIPVSKIGEMFKEVEAEHAAILADKDKELKTHLNRPQEEVQKENLSHYVRYVFEQVGTPEQIQVAEEVLKAFNQKQYGK